MFVTPKVFLTGYTQIDMAGIRSYLEYTKQLDFVDDLVAADSQKISGAEALCSMYAKLCYKSLVLGRNANVKKVREIQDNLAATFASGHGCYDDETDVLTADGWKRWSAVTEDDLFATRTMAGMIAYQRPSRLLLNQPYNGAMYRTESDHVDLLVTPNHNMLVCKTTTREGRCRYDESYELIKANDLCHVSHAYVKSGTWELDDAPVYPFEPEVFALLGFTIGDGSVDQGGQRVRFSLRRERKITYLLSLCDALGWEVSSGNGDKFSVRVPVAEIADLFRDVYNQDGEKVIPAGVLTGSSKAQLLALYAGLLQSDGSKGETSLCFDSTSQRLIDQVQQLCLHVGLSANILYTYDREDRPSSFGDKPITRLGIVRRSNKPEVNRWSGQVGKSYWVEGYEGVVHCAEVPNHTLYVRRNGKPVWCGNSVFEHVGFNFIVTDCSRVFSHELVRHRAGTAFSQTSGRYCRPVPDADGNLAIDFVHDPILDVAADDIREALTYLGAIYRRMEARLGLMSPEEFECYTAQLLKEIQASDAVEDVPYAGMLRGLMSNLTARKYEPVSDFDRKKKITSALRRILPNGQSNEIGFSCNIRTLRHCVQIRTQRFAEWEIRVVFAQIYQLIKDKFPMVFHGAKERMVDGLPEIYGMKLQPYDVAVEGLPPVELLNEVARRDWKFPSATEEDAFKSMVNSALKELEPAT